MVQISAEDFNREMDAYLSSKKTEAPKPQKKVKKEEFREVEFSDVEEYDSIKEPFYQKVVDFFVGSPKGTKKEEEYVEMKTHTEEAKPETKPETKADEFEEFDKEEKPKKGVFSKMFGWFMADEDNAGEKDFNDAKEEAPKESINSELKRLLKIQHFWMQQLPPEKIKEFRNSPDYIEYKELLEKYNLIKKE